MRKWLTENATEIALCLGVVLVTSALWSVIGRLALLVPGGILLWLGLPVRQWFIERPPVFDERKKS